MSPLEPELSMSIEISKDIDSSGFKGSICQEQGINDKGSYLCLCIILRSKIADLWFIPYS